MYKVILWGVGADYQKYYNLIKYEEYKGNIDIVAVVDKDNWQKNVDGYNMISVKEICYYEFDYIIVTSSKYYNDIVNEAIQLQIALDLLIPIRVFQIPCFDFGEYAQLKRNPISIISDDCWGGRVYNYLGLRYDSPFINFWVYNNDFVKMVSDLKCYMDKPLVLERQGSVTEAPVGSLGEDEEKVYLHFIHAYSFEEAKADFERRRKRINMNNLFIKMQYGWGEYSRDVFCKYERLHYSKKILLVPFQTESKSGIELDYFREEYARGKLEKTYHIKPRDFIGYSQKIELVAREYNIIHMLVTGEVIKRITS